MFKLILRSEDLEQLAAIWAVAKEEGIEFELQTHAAKNGQIKRKKRKNVLSKYSELKCVSVKPVQAAPMVSESFAQIHNKFGKGAFSREEALDLLCHKNPDYDRATLSQRISTMTTRGALKVV